MSNNTHHRYKDFTFDWTRGRTLLIDLEVTRTENGGEPEPEDLSAGEIWVTGKESILDVDSDALFRLNVENGGVSRLDAAAGRARATIPAASSQDLPDKPTAVYVDCVRVTASGERYSFLQGTVTYHPSIERTLTA